ncbi:hypothetical protein Cst_c21020 [Thermoclostridium stercorarium subsp. stercorarium DSM 8532]|jgi:hypothetical protein|uniref:Uncharacterized protein n=3 Tax=Thermoclostridium stercorarium TaxID=1510 RepID=L7VQX5_THES1|nr:hypothetical protein [Thermoclostridium stercorarium]AGC69074.1 hypothetical protein Cst_c21020 [Thermoclostridium stercorarium subsp. stercorarium DSM 8532]AGI40047.1 hypothetical protein Clst_2009 [Thermoclostridium stercorarium subsp. stercorarium DSM 8532]ANW99366.1 hypothetical protein CSTERTH_10145 [Thermoclostridium stercorarium subsp. thermolacticum DSM 2910]ANX01996.1 hypothetical protein CSTERLE_10635 [Thermoclostridium stercorarium subsp. leptospartum DSM 9219]UZQ85035.1 hypothet
MFQHIQMIYKKLSSLNRISKSLLKIGLWSLITLTAASAVLAVINMLEPVSFSCKPLLIQSLFIYGFYLWAELTIGALILDSVFQ